MGGQVEKIDREIRRRIGRYIHPGKIKGVAYGGGEMGYGRMSLACALEILLMSECSRLPGNVCGMLTYLQWRVGAEQLLYSWHSAREVRLRKTSFDCVLHWSASSAYACHPDSSDSAHSRLKRSGRWRSGGGKEERATIGIGEGMQKNDFKKREET